MEKANPKSTTWTIDWSELKRIGLAIYDGNWSDVKREKNRAFLRGRWENPPETWSGFSRGQMERWLREGYQSDAIRGLEDFIPPVREKRKLRFTEEGDEFHFDIAASGGDNYMSEWTKRDEFPGLAIMVNISVSTNVRAEEIIRYLTWVCRIVYACDSAGIDTEVTMRNTVVDLLQPNSARWTTVVRVKKENEQTDFLSWSPMLSPGGFRGLMFLAKTLHGEMRDQNVNHSMGSSSSIPRGWSVKFEAETRTVNIDCPYEFRSFPEDSMMAQLREALKAASTHRN